MASNHNTSFIHLRFHSAYSLLEGAIRIPQLAEFCENMNIPAIGISDRNNLFGALEFSEAMVQKGIQPIIGVSLGVQWEAELAKTQGFDQHGFVALIASSEEGYRNLLKLVSLAHLGEEKEQKEEGHIMPAAGQVNCATLGKYAEGLICLTGGPEGLVNQLLAHGHKDKASKVLS
ncbi:MAG: PHP domain-containing protein, partial [Parvibaculales bacterium]